MPRSPRAERAREAPMTMRFAAWLLADACILLGIGASFVVPALYRILEPIGSLVPDPRVTPAAGLWVEAPRALGHLSPVLIAALLGVVVAAAIAILGFVHKRPFRLADTWGCGRVTQTPRMEYTASAFAEPLRRVFAELYRPTQDLAVNVHPESRYFVQSITFTSDVQPWFERVFYAPVVRSLRGAAIAVRRLQSGSVHAYLVYLVVALLAALAFVWWTS